MTQRLKTEDLSYKDLFNMGFEVFIANIKPMLAMSFLVFAPISVFNYLFLSGDILSVYMDEMYAYLLSSASGSTKITEFPESALLLYCSMLVEGLILMPLISGGVTKLIMSNMEGGSGGLSEVLYGSFGNIHKIVPTVMLMSIFTTAGVMLFVVPGIYLAVMYAFCVEAVIVTGQLGMKALKASASVVSGRWFKTLSFIILIHLFNEAYNFITGSLTGLLFNIIPYFQILDSVVSLAFAVFIVYFYIVQSLWFINKYNCPRQSRQ